MTLKEEMIKAMPCSGKKLLKLVDQHLNRTELNGEQLIEEALEAIGFLRTFYPLDKEGNLIKNELV